MAAPTSINRPLSLSEVVGQKEVVSFIQKCKEGGDNLPSVMLFAGPTGCGKTTVAYLTAALINDLKVDEHTDFRNLPYVEFLQGSKMGKGELEDLQLRLKPDMLTAASGKTAFFIVDEAHLLTSSAKGLALTAFEDIPQGTCVILCTMEPDKLDKALQSRAITFTFKSASYRSLLVYGQQLLEKWGQTLTDEQISLAAEISDGSYRTMHSALISLCHSGKVSSAQEGGSQKESNPFSVFRAIVEGSKLSAADVAFIVNSDWFSLEAALATMSLSLVAYHKGQLAEKAWVKMFPKAEHLQRALLLVDTHLALPYSMRENAKKAKLIGGL